jgi:ABC-type sugar transport system, periplasmic component
MKKISAATAGAAVMALALTACGSGGDDSTGESGDQSGAASSTSSPSSEGVVELTFQTWVPNIDQAVDQFNAAHDNIHVNLETINAGPDGGYATMFSAVEAGNAADVAQVGYDWLPDFVRNDSLEDITEYVQPAADVFVQWQLEAMTFNGQILGVPQASSPLGMFYRSDVFEEAGIEKAPETWDDFYEAAKKIHELGPDYYIAAYAFNQTPWMIGLAEQAGAEWFSAGEDSWTVDIDGDATISVADYWQKLLDEDLVKPVADMSNEWFADIQSGKISTWISGSWADAIIRGNAPDSAGKWSVAYPPQWKAGEKATGTWGGGSANVVLKGTEHPAEAAEFALWLNSNPESVSTLVSVGAGWPAISDISEIASIQEDPEVFDFYDGQNIWEVFAESDANVSSSWRWPPMVSTLYSSLTDNVKAAVDGGKPTADAYKKTQTDMVAAFKEAGISVAE